MMSHTPAFRLLAPFICLALGLSTAAYADTVLTTANTNLPPAANLAWSLKLPASPKVPYHGALGLAASEAQGGTMLYPAPNAVGFLAAIMTHAMIEESSRNAKQRKEQEEADKVLTPYRATLAQISFKDLLQRSINLVTVGKPQAASSDAHADRWLVVAAPAFTLTQNQSTLVLDNTVAIYAPGESRKAAYINHVRVVADASNASDPKSWWTRNQGEEIREESARLLATSLDIALRDASRDYPTMTYKTLRYMEGGAERIERAQPLSEHCGRLLMRSLRGYLMSVPMEPDATDQGGDCGNHASPVTGQGGMPIAG